MKNLLDTSRYTDANRNRAFPGRFKKGQAGGGFANYIKATRSNPAWSPKLAIKANRANIITMQPL